MSSKKTTKKPDFEKISQNKALKKRRKRRKMLIITVCILILCAAVTAFGIVINSALNADKNALVSGTWVPSGAKNASGDEAELSEVYGVNYSSYQGSLTFSGNGVFSLWLSPGNPDDGTHGGKYSVSSENTVTLSFDDGTETDAKLEKQGSEIKSVIVNYNNYEVSFVKQ